MFVLFVIASAMFLYLMIGGVYSRVRRPAIAEWASTRAYYKKLSDGTRKHIRDLTLEEQKKMYKSQVTKTFWGWPGYMISNNLDNSFEKFSPTVHAMKQKELEAENAKVRETNHQLEHELGLRDVATCDDCEKMLAEEQRRIDREWLRSNNRWLMS